MQNPVTKLTAVLNPHIYRLRLMYRLIKFPLIFSLFFFSVLSVAFGSFWLHQRISKTKEIKTLVNSLVMQKPTQVATLNSNFERNIADIVSSISTSDARPLLIERFLDYYNSPMKGHGKDFVEIADRYGLDYRLLPAIALHESAAGKRIPPGSYNAWGWAVFTGQQTGAEFDTWAHGIETVAKGLRKTYVDDGLITPEKIQPRYAPPSSSWAAGVRRAMDQISEG